MGQDTHLDSDPLQSLVITASVISTIPHPNILGSVRTVDMSTVVHILAGSSFKTATASLPSLELFKFVVCAYFCQPLRLSELSLTFRKVTLRRTVIRCLALDRSTRSFVISPPGPIGHLWCTCINRVLPSGVGPTGFPPIIDSSTAPTTEP